MLTASRHHFRQVVPRHSDATHEVDLENLPPVFVSGVREVAQDGRPEAVDKDIGVRRLCKEGLGAGGRREVGGDTRDIGLGEGFPHLPYCLVHPLVPATADND